MGEFDKIKSNLNRIRENLPTKKGEFKYIGVPINFERIKSFILESKITEDDIIFLHSNNFCDLMEEYRRLYKTSMLIPFRFLGVLIEEAENGRVPKDRISIVYQQ